MKKAKINELRRNLGLTQAELAAVVGCSLPCVEHWSRGYRSPSEVFDTRLRRLQRLYLKSQATGIPFDPKASIKRIQKEEDEDDED